jgi:hypothetical protein
VSGSELPLQDSGDRWSRPWLVTWAVVALTLIILIFVVPFEVWALATLVGFGGLEAYGLWRADDAYPPLTDVIARYVPRWVAFSAIYGITGGAAGTWFGFHPARLALLVGLVGWFTAHFDVAFDAGGRLQEREKYRRLHLLPKRVQRRAGQSR